MQEWGVNHCVLERMHMRAGVSGQVRFAWPGSHMGGDFTYGPMKWPKLCKTRGKTNLPGDSVWEGGRVCRPMCVKLSEQYRRSHCFHNIVGQV